MKDKIYLDSNFIITTLVKEHPFFQKACMISEKIKTWKLFISFLVIDEVIFNLSFYHLSKEDIHKHLKNGILSIDNLYLISTSNLKEDLDDYLQAWVRSNLKPRDALHLHMMRYNKISQIATFDQDFIRHRKKLGITII